MSEIRTIFLKTKYGTEITQELKNELKENKVKAGKELALTLYLNTALNMNKSANKANIPCQYLSPLVRSKAKTNKKVNEIYTAKTKANEKPLADIDNLK